MFPLSSSVTCESQKSLLYFCFFCAHVSLGDNFVSFLSEMYLRSFNFHIQNTHSLAVGGFLLLLGLGWNVVELGTE